MVVTGMGTHPEPSIAHRHLWKAHGVGGTFPAQSCVCSWDRTVAWPQVSPARWGVWCPQVMPGGGSSQALLPPAVCGTSRGAFPPKASGCTSSQRVCEGHMNSEGFDHCSIWRHQNPLCLRQLCSPQSKGRWAAVAGARLCCLPSFPPPVFPSEAFPKWFMAPCECLGWN